MWCQQRDFDLALDWIHLSVGIVAHQASLEFVMPLDLVRSGPPRRPTVMIMLP
jgi:hypothetical protein